MSLFSQGVMLDAFKLHFAHCKHITPFRDQQLIRFSKLPSIFYILIDIHTYANEL